MTLEDRPVTRREKLIGFAIVIAIFIWSLYELYEADIFNLWLNFPSEFNIKARIILPCIASFFAIIYLGKRLLFQNKEARPNQKMKADD